MSEELFEALVALKEEIASPAFDQGFFLFFNFILMI